MTIKVIDPFQQIRQYAHPGCIVCSEENKRGLQLDFNVTDDGVVTAEFTLERIFEGYPAMLHGGIICMILDGAMTNCLFAQNCIAVTADLQVRFRHPVHTDQSVAVRAWIHRSASCFYELKAEILQNGQLKTTATGKFMRQNQLDGRLNS
ncbi:MAG: PaaI family thioesterase [Sedimentisphaerales bacterium]|nr:PaaI family thioesterase [Sedimentisphaerales bacterium]